MRQLVGAAAWTVGAIAMFSALPRGAASQGAQPHALVSQAEYEHWQVELSN